MESANECSQLRNPSVTCSLLETQLTSFKGQSNDYAM